MCVCVACVCVSEAMIHINVREALCHGENGHRPLLSGYEPEMSDMDDVLLEANFPGQVEAWGPSIDLSIKPVLFFFLEH